MHQQLRCALNSPLAGALLLACLLAACGDEGVATSNVPADRTDTPNTPVDTGPADVACVKINVAESRVGEPALGSVALAFSVTSCEGQGVTGLTAADFSITENGQPISATEAQATILDRQAEAFVTLVLDNSPSVAAAGALDDAVDAALAFVDTLFSDGLQTTQVRVAFFSKFFEVKQDFTNDITLVKTAVESLRNDTTGSNTTNLYGAVLDALEGSAAQKQARLDAMDGGVLAIGQVVIFTDGSDQAALYTLAEAKSAVSASSDDVMTLAFGGEIDADVLAELGPAGSFLSESASGLDEAFTGAAQKLVSRKRAQYVLAYCTPKLAGSHQLVISLDGKGSSTPITFSAEGFSAVGTECSLGSFTSVCEDKTCGGLWCGGCNTTPCTPDGICACKDPKFAGMDCDECASSEFTGTNCDQCVDPKFTGTNCDICEGPWSGPMCTTPAIIEVAAGVAHTCALQADGRAECWGKNDFGQSSPPTGAFVAISAGSTFTCGLREDGSAECWGLNNYGQISPPTGAFIAITSGDVHTCGLREDGNAECWGRNLSGQSSPPVGAFDAIAAGGNHTCGLRDNGNLVECWGGDLYGQSNPPVGAFDAIAAGGNHTCGLRYDGSAECWGWDESSQSSVPSGVFVAIAAGAAHTCGLREDGSAECWGLDGDSQSTPVTGAFVELAAGTAHTCGLREDGSAECWGWDNYGQSSPPADYTWK